MCNIAEYTINDERSIRTVLGETAKLSQSWQTESEMALTTGWFTYPTPRDTAGFRGFNDEHLFVLWFGGNWIGTRKIIEGKHVRLFKRTTPEELKALRTSLKMKN
ncbi:hypothetical protein D3879_16895 [Pseudomonas cavernicola]|uniref:Uncharacterized protein n=1 Tax=Pseudomonas cavernicola TaxID=2320866 RepID=A0A418XB57_9PSED|nr:hypothetical protein D3879_16895 [Pseudomonas cavernicola]